MYRWKEIYLDLKNSIVNNVYDGYLPTENQLVIKYKTSRETIRKIYAKLENENLIISIKARGRLKRRSSKDFKFKSYRDMYLDAQHSIYKIIEQTNEIILLEIKRFDIDGTLVIIEESTIYLENLTNSNLNENMFNEFGILDTIKKYSKNKISGADKKITFENTNKKICEELNFYNYILNDCVVFDEFDNVIERSKNYYHPLFFEYSFYEQM